MGRLTPSVPNDSSPRIADEPESPADDASPLPVAPQSSRARNGFAFAGGA